MVEQANIEIIEPFIRLGDDAAINLDDDLSRRLYALAWEKFEKALVETNRLYNLTPSGDTDEQSFQFNRVKRLLWEVADLKQAVEVIYHMTSIPEDIEDTEDDA